MRKLSEYDYKLLTQLCQLKEPILLKTLHSYLSDIYDNVVYDKEYLFAEGTIPIALVAHVDTVFRFTPTNIYYDERQGVLWSPEGLGADDRAGVFAILKILKAGYRPHVIFTTGEEKGAIGSMHMIKAHPTCPFKDLRYIIQLDRRGTNDCVFYDCANQQFIDYVEKFGFTEAIGSFTDISEICPEWKIAGVNLSIGYEDEHSVSETLHVNPMLATIAKTIKMLKAAQSAPSFQFVPAKYCYTYHSYKHSKADDYYSQFYDGYYSDFDGSYLGDTIQCDVCGKNFSEFEVIPVESKNLELKYYCGDCLTEDRVQWCSNCGEAFEIDPLHPDQQLCYSCLAELEASQNWKRSQKNDHPRED